MKPRFGSMGKGITYISPGSWQTNFNFRNNRVTSRKSDYGWRFKDITGNHFFLGQIVKKDILIEDEVSSLVLKRKKVDLRVYTFLKKAIYVYPKINYRRRVTTNISQGARGAPEILRLIPKSLIAKAKTEAERTARVLDLDLAGIDVIIDSNQKDVYVIDVNVFPGYPKRKTFNLAKAIIKELTRAHELGDLEFKRLRSALGRS